MCALAEDWHKLVACTTRVLPLAAHIVRYPIGGGLLAIYHCSIKIIKRGLGKSAVAAAAYRSGEKILNEYDGMQHDYTRKGGVVHSEILLPFHAPAEFSDRATLWNTVEQTEKHRRAQLAREIEIALPNELNHDEQVKLVRDYCQQTFVDKGMCCDFNIHDPDKEPKNTHAHIMLTMRPLNEDGTWGDKQRKEYILDAAGNRIYDPKKRQYKCNTIPTTDWNEQTKAEEWRAAWAEFANRTLEQNGFGEKLDHRSYARQGVEQIPTVHLGVAASQMERKGIATEKGNLNRMIRNDNRLIRKLKERVAQLQKWLREVREKQEPKEPTLAELLIESENSSTLRGLKSTAGAVAYLQQNNIQTWENLESHTGAIHDQMFAVSDKLRSTENRMQALKELLDMEGVYRETRPVFESYQRQGSPAKQEKFYKANRVEIMRHEATRKYLYALLPDKKLRPKQWQGEYGQLTKKREIEYAELKAVREEIKQVEGIRKAVERHYRKPAQQQRNTDIEH